MIGGRKRTLKAHMGAGEHPVIRPPASDETVSVVIDGRRLEVPAGTTILEAALGNETDIPYFCFHPGLSPEGNCRMCLVELHGHPKLEPSCIMPVSNGMIVSTDSSAVQEARRGVMEFLLLNHPLDCPWCDKAGECMLQDNSFDHGHGTTRHRLTKRTYPVKDFSPRLKMFMNRCIHCTRCVRFLREIEGKEEFGLYQRGAQVDVGTYIEHNLSNSYQGCLADVCPVGALVTKPFLYRARVFDLEAQSSICTMCSAGCSIYVDRSRNRVARLRPRPNLAVNDWWMCDRGRFEWDWIERDRLTAPVREARRSPSGAEGDAGAGEVCTWQEAISQAHEKLVAADSLTGSLGGIVSATATCEEIALFEKLVHGLGGMVSAWYGPQGRVDPAERIDFLQRSDRNPNTRGLEVILPETRPLERLLDDVEEGTVQTVLVLGTSLDEGTATTLAAARELIVITSHIGPAASNSTLALPGAVWVEKEGTFVNGDGHLQRFLQAVDIETDARPDASILSALLRRCRLSAGYEGPEDVFAEIARQVMPFFGLSYGTIPPGGVRLDLGISPEEPS